MSSIHEIQAAVCRQFGTAPIEMVSPRKSAAVSLPRQVAMYLCRVLTPYSSPTISRQFGDRHHTTVLYACKIVAGRLQIDPDLAAKVAAIKQEIDKAA
jgi:chromosomal replication initiator protein